MPPEKFQPDEKAILVVTCQGHFLSHFNMLIFPNLVLPLTGITGLPMAQVLALSFWQYLLFGVTALPWGLIADRWRAKPLMYIYFAGCAVSALGAAWYVNDPGMLSLCLAGIGLFSGIYHPVGLGMISKGVARTSVAMGYNGMAGMAGLAAAPLVAGVMNYLSGPAGVYVAVAFINGSGIYLMSRTRAVVGAGNGRKQPAPPANAKAAFAVLLIAMMTAGIAYRGATVILPSLLELKGETILASLDRFWPGTLTGNMAAAAVMAVIYGLGGVLGQFVAGHLGERLDPRVVYLSCHLMSIPGALLAFWASGWALAGWAAWYMFFLLSMQPMENTVLSRLTPESLRSSAFGLKFILTFGLGAVAVRLDGLVSDWFSPSAVMIMLAVASTITTLAVVQMWRVTRAYALR